MLMVVARVLWVVAMVFRVVSRGLHRVLVCKGELGVITRVLYVVIGSC